MTVKVRTTNLPYTFQILSLNWVIPPAPQPYYIEKTVRNDSYDWGSYLFFKETTDSVSTPSWYKKVPQQVRWVAKTGKMYQIDPPVLPKLHIPRPPVHPKFIPPILRVLKNDGILKVRYGSTLRKVFMTPAQITKATKKNEEINRARTLKAQKRYSRALARYNTHLQLWRNKKQLKEQKYAVAMSKYPKRLEKFNKFMEKRKNGYTRMVRIRNKKVRTDNPYTRTREFHVAPTGVVHTTQYFTKDGPRASPVVVTYETDLSTHSWIVGIYYPLISYAYVIPDVDSRNTAFASADARARSKLFEKLNQYDLHIGNIIAERNQTVKMISDIARTIARMTPKNVVKTALGALRSKNLANAWLQYVFGIKPLLQDAYSAGSALAKILDPNKSDKIVVRSVSKGSSSGEKKWIGVLDGSYPSYDRYLHLETSVQISYVLEYKITNGPLDALQGLGLINPAEIVWEVMPWSFVIDWFLPLGNWIQSLSSDIGLTFVGGTKVTTVTDRYTLKVYGNYGINPSTWVKRSFNVQGSYTKETKTREVLTSAPLVPFPQFKNPFSKIHLITSLALLRQMFH